MRLLIIIPCFNEAKSIRALIEEIRSIDPEWETLVVDDGSTDATYTEARALSSAVRLMRNLGIGGAVQTGIKYAELHGFDFCVQIDGDGQHPPAEIRKLLAAYDSLRANIIVGSRYTNADNQFRSTWARRFGSNIIAWTLWRLFRCRITDPTSGMRLLDRRAIALFAKNYPHDFPEPISLARAVQSGLTVGETPVEMRAREHGNSSIVGLKPLAYMFRVIGYIVLARLTRTFG